MSLPPKKTKHPLHKYPVIDVKMQNFVSLQSISLLWHIFFQWQLYCNVCWLCDSVHGYLLKYLQLGAFWILNGNKRIIYINWNSTIKSECVCVCVRAHALARTGTHAHMHMHLSIYRYIQGERDIFLLNWPKCTSSFSPLGHKFFLILPSVLFSHHKRHSQ